MRIRTLLYAFILFALSAFALSGCGGGGGGSSSTTSVATEDATGVWDGTFTENGIGTFDLTGIFINNDLYFISIAGDTIYQGTYSVSGSTLNGTATIFQINGTSFGTSNISATVNTGASVTGSFTTSYGSSGTVSLSYDPITDRGSSLSTIAGIWSVTDGTYTLTVTIDGNGSLTGSDTDGCVYSGTINIIDPSVNIYGVNITTSSCGVLDGAYSGYGVVGDDVNTNDTFIYAISNSNYVLLGPLTRQ